MWGQGAIDELREAADRFDREQAKGVVQTLLSDLGVHQASATNDLQRGAFDQLRRARFFDLMRDLGEGLTRANVASDRTRRQHAQALIELTSFDDAMAVLDALLEDPSCSKAEKAEAGGLIGRVNKQIYIDRLGELGAARRSVIQSSVDAYFTVYLDDRKEFTWQGINAVAMRLRASRDDVKVTMAADALDIAREIRKTLAQPRYHWDLATAAEACIALGDWPEAKTLVEAYVQHRDLDSFSAASTLRQLRQVWQLTDEGPGGEILALLQGAVLRGSTDATKPAPERLGARLSLEVGELRTSIANTNANEDTLEKVFGSASARSYTWMAAALGRAKAVARIETATGDGKGTGFLVRASALFPDAPPTEAVLVTNSHVLGKKYPTALRVSDAVVRFEAVDLQRTFQVTEILFESPPAELDVTIVTLDAAVVGVEPCPLAPREEPSFDPAQPRNCYVIGHPGGLALALSIDDTLQVGWKAPLLHYRTPTEPGNSGSPVFDASWRLLALHHSGSASMKRLDGQPGTYEANEGIWFHAIVDAIAAARAQGQIPPKPVLESRSTVVRPAFRRSVFISYAHADEAWRERLQTHLKPLSRDATIELWDDRKIPVGSNWLAEIERQLDTASVAILLVSARFLASDFIAEKEFPKLLEDCRKRGLAIVPIAISASNFGWWQDLAKIQFANDPKRPLNTLAEGEQELALAEIAAIVGRTLNVSQLSNTTAAMDAIAFQSTGLGGTVSHEVGVAGFHIRAEQLGRDIMTTTSNGSTTIAISWEQISTLPPDAQQLISAYNTAICDLYDRWTEELPKRTARDEGVRKRALDNLDQTRTDLCRELNSLLDFFGQCGWSLNDHYMGVRHICR